MPRARIDASRAYEDVCERIFRDWLAGRISRLNLWSGFSIDHCPEPYLEYLPGDDPLIFVRYNPGKGEPFQHRSAIDSAGSPIDSSKTYNENARRLALWYRGTGASTIESAARTEVRAMVSLAERLEASGMREVDCFPLHSKRVDVERHIFAGAPLVGAIGEYREVCTRYVAQARNVIAICWCAPDRAARKVRLVAQAIGLDIDRADFLPLKRKGNAMTVGLYGSVHSDGLRAIFCRQGYNGLPAKIRMPMAIQFLRGLSIANH